MCSQIVSCSDQYAGAKRDVGYGVDYGSTFNCAISCFIKSSSSDSSSSPFPAKGFHWMLFLDFFSISPMPSSTFVMSYIRLFWTCKICSRAQPSLFAGK